VLPQRRGDCHARRASWNEYPTRMGILAYSTLFRSRFCRMPLSYLDRLEAESIFIFREVVAIWDNPVLLYSDTTWKFRATIEFSRCSGQAARPQLIVHKRGGTARRHQPVYLWLAPASARSPGNCATRRRRQERVFECFRCELGRRTRARRQAQSDGQIWLISRTLTAISRLVQWDLAERQGFEPWVRFHAHTLSKRAP
jgi:hypothetical protein